MVALPDVGDVAFAWAADRLLKEPGRTFFPTPNELRSHLRVERRMALPNPEAPPAPLRPDTCPVCQGRGGIHAPDCASVPNPEPGVPV